MLRKIFLTLSLSIFALTLLGCENKESRNVIKVGTIAGPETQLMEVAKAVAKDCYNLDVSIVTFNDYNMPNIALNDGGIDANMFQHEPYLEAQVAARDYGIVSVGKTFIYPMGIYSDTLTQLANLPMRAKVALPNDPSNQARALLLLQQAGLIQLAMGKGTSATLLDVSLNPKQLQLIPLAAAQLPRSLSDVAIAVINTNYAIPAGLSPAKALYVESVNSPYANVVAVRIADRDNLKVMRLLSALHSPMVIAAAKHIFGDAAIPAWNMKQPIMPCHPS